MLANARKESFFHKVLKRALSGQAEGNALERYIRQQRTGLKAGTGKKSLAQARSFCFFDGVQKLGVRIRLDEGLLERLKHADPLALQKDLDDLLTFLTKLGQDALRMVFPLTPYSFRVLFQAGKPSPEDEKKAQIETIKQINRFLSLMSAAHLAEGGDPTEEERARFNRKRARALSPLEGDVCDAVDLMFRGFDGSRFSPEVMGRFLAAGLKTEEVVAEFNRLPHRPETSPSEALVTHLLRRILGRCLAPDETYRNPIYFSKPKFEGDAEERLFPQLCLADYAEKYHLRSLNLKPGTNAGTPWEPILEKLREKLPKEAFERCFGGSRFCREVGDRLYIFFPENGQPERIQTEHQDVFALGVPKEKEIYYLTPEVLEWIGTPLSD